MAVRNIYYQDIAHLFAFSAIMNNNTLECTKKSQGERANEVAPTTMGTNDTKTPEAAIDGSAEQDRCSMSRSYLI